MKLKLDLGAHLVSLAAAAGLAACSSAKPTPDAPAQAAQPAPQAAAPAPAPKTEEAPVAQGQADLDKALAELKDVSVFFEYDSATLTREAQSKLSDVAQILSRYPDLKIRIAGNCDERGSEQYNLALGQRRAEAARKYLANLGVKSDQLTAVSFGAEKPKVSGHDESAWKQNRRDDLSPETK